MERIVKEIPLDCEIALISDTHIGSFKCHDSGIDEAIDFVASKKNRYWTHLGDWIEANTTDDKRYDVETNEQPIPLLQADEVVKKFKRIAKKGLAGLLGNHERKQHRVGNFVRDKICKELSIPYGTYECRLILQPPKENPLRFFLTHGTKVFRSYAQTEFQIHANKQAALKRYLKNKMADCHLMATAHAHWLTVLAPDKTLYLTDGIKGVKQNRLSQQPEGKGYIHPDSRYYCCTGSFYKLYVDGISGYNEPYDPNDLGFLNVIIEGGKIVDVKEIIV